MNNNKNPPSRYVLGNLIIFSFAAIMWYKVVKRDQQYNREWERKFNRTAEERFQEKINLKLKRLNNKNRNNDDEI